MLVLTRKLGEQVIIGDGIEVTVLAIRRGRIKLGINCPDDVPVRRKEVLERVHPALGRSLAGAAPCRPQLSGARPALG